MKRGLEFLLPLTATISLSCYSPENNPDYEEGVVRDTVEATVREVVVEPPGFGHVDPSFIILDYNGSTIKYSGGSKWASNYKIDQKVSLEIIERRGVNWFRLIS